MKTARTKCLSNVENSQGITPCPNHREPGADYCATHLARASEQFVAAITAAKARHPSSAAHPSDARFVQCCPRCISPGHTLRECPV
jgi:hypothetical protein